MLTEERLNEIEARTAAATPGPWKLHAARDSCGDNIFSDSMPPRRIANTYGDVDSPNAIFIAHARTDIPTLVAEVRRLRELTSQTADVLQAILDSGYAENRGLIAMRIDRLREQTQKGEMK